MDRLRAKSLLLTGYLEALLQQQLAEHVTVVTPADPAQRGEREGGRGGGRGGGERERGGGGERGGRRYICVVKFVGICFR
jgi:kynureninase